MPYELEVPREGDPLPLCVSQGEVLFVLGANGSGKSSLMHKFYLAHHNKARRITAHRQTWLSPEVITHSPHQRGQLEVQMINRDRQDESRWTDQHASFRASFAISDLIALENARARRIAAAVDREDIASAREQSANASPIEAINALLASSNIPISLSIEVGHKVLAAKHGGKPYSIAALSDGERNAILIASNVLTAKSDTLLLIDEPERHLHRSIISPLLTMLFAGRSDCVFVVSTHEVMLPLDNPNCRTLLLRNCSFGDSSVRTWDADLTSTDVEIDESLKKDILGARRKVLFVEGVESSLDNSLYSLVFPDVSVIPRGTCREVEQAVSAIRNAEGLHWIRAFGIVDNDGRDGQDLAHLMARGIYALSLFSVESVYYHPDVQEAAAVQHCQVTGEDAHTRVSEAKRVALDAIGPRAERLSVRRSEKLIREQIFKQLPKAKKICAGQRVTIDLDVPTIVAEEQDRIEKAIRSGDLASVIRQYPVRETPALDAIGRLEKLRLRSRAGRKWSETGIGA